MHQFWKVIIGFAILAIPFIALGIFVEITSNLDKYQSYPDPVIKQVDESSYRSGSYVVDPGSSILRWRGEKVIGSDHTGTLQVASGYFELNEDGNTGEVVIAMNSLKSDNSQLTQHLKNDDFFSVDTFPEARFVLRDLDKKGGVLTAAGDLTIKGVTQVVSFPVVISESTSGRLYIDGKATIDRTQFGMRYGSGKFFENLADKAIADEFELEFRLTADRK